jgi:hypothetical protein
MYFITSDPKKEWGSYESTPFLRTHLGSLFCRHCNGRDLPLKGWHVTQQTHATPEKKERTIKTLGREKMQKKLF